MTGFSFNCPILLLCIRTSNTMFDTKSKKMFMEFLKLSTLVRMKSFDSGIKLSSNHTLKIKKDIINFTFILHKIDPCKMDEVINK